MKKNTIGECCSLTVKWTLEEDKYGNILNNCPPTNWLVLPYDSQISYLISLSSFFFSIEWLELNLWNSSSIGLHGMLSFCFTTFRFHFMQPFLQYLSFDNISSFLKPSKCSTWKKLEKYTINKIYYLLLPLCYGNA